MLQCRYLFKKQYTRPGQDPGTHTFKDGGGGKVIKLEQAIVVEGKYDKRKLDKTFDYVVV